MRNVAVNIKIDRHLTNGSARVTGHFGDKNVDLSLRRDVSDSKTRIQGLMDLDSVNLSVDRSFDRGYGALRGRVGKSRLNGSIERHTPDGDTTFELSHSRMTIDRSRQGQTVSIDSFDTRGAFQREPKDGDESGSFRHDGDFLDYSIDRQEGTGDFSLTGRSSAGRFSLQAKRSLSDGDLQMKGTMPEGTEWMPLLWELLGDGKNIPDNDPLYPGSVLAMSLHMHDEV